MSNEPHETPSLPGSRFRWFHTVGLALLAVYGPFVVMATYMLLFVPCSHCQRAAWLLVPAGPGFLPVDLCCRRLMGSRLDDTVAFILGATISLGLVAGLIPWVRRSGGGWVAVLGLQLICSSFLAYALMSLIRA